MAASLLFAHNPVAIKTKQWAVERKTGHLAGCHDMRHDIYRTARCST